MARPAVLDRAAGAVSDRQIIDDLGAVFETIDTRVGEAEIDELGNVHTHLPTLLGKLASLRDGGFGHHIPERHHRSLDRMVHRFEDILHRNMRLEAELAHLNASSNVILSTPLDNVPVLTTSTIVTFGSPYSGIDFMICAALLPAELTPAGRFATLNFMGIDFANPSSNPANVTYVAPAGTLGTPNQLGMGLSSFYTNLTAPRGARVFEPWTGWVFDASAKISFSVYNPSASFPATYLLDWLMRASPCPQQGQYDRGMALGHVRYHEGIAELMNAIHGFAIGVGPKGNSAHAPLRAGHHMVARHSAAAPIYSVLGSYK
jgi:hypothetical protein